jgi:2-iminobutanoate/2-iminopropanoate deaminase
MTLNNDATTKTSSSASEQSNAAIYAPPSRQHVTAGPYSPVLEINPNKLIVICGQAAVDLEGKLISEDFAVQTRATLDNCLKQLSAADCDMSDVFKVNVYLTDLDTWDEFNDIYRTYLTAPYPVRTAIQSGLLHGFQVEVEMWAARK